MKKRRKNILNYPIVIESCQEGGFFADCPSLPGCHVQTETVEEAMTEMKGAIKAYLEDIQTRHESIPQPEQAIITTIPISF